MSGGIPSTLQDIFRPYRGILAADERPSSMDARLEASDITPGEDTRNRYRDMLFSTPNLERTVSGVILSEDTFLAHTTSGTLTRDYLADSGIAVGVKVDGGLVPYEKNPTLSVTVGLDGLEEKCVTYRRTGVRFLKWRSVIPVSGVDEAFLDAMSLSMATYASTALRHDLVPIVEPEVLLAGDHTAEESAETLERTVSAVLRALRAQQCSPRQCILKTSFVTDGLERGTSDADRVAEHTLSVLKKLHLDGQKGFYGIVFLSGGLDSGTAIEYIQKIRALQEDPSDGSPFSAPLTFSYGRALQEPALREWGGDDGKRLSAQVIFTQTLQHAVRKYKGREDMTLVNRNPA